MNILLFLDHKHHGPFARDTTDGIKFEPLVRIEMSIHYKINIQHFVVSGFLIVDSTEQFSFGWLIFFMQACTRKTTGAIVSLKVQERNI